MDKPLLNVVFATDRAYVAPLAVALRSLFHSNRHLRFRAHVINADIDETSWHSLQSLAMRYGQTLVNARVEADELRALVTTYHFAPSNYYRLFAQDKILADRALYLDADVLVLGDVEPLFNVDLGEAFVAAVENRNFSRHAELEMDPHARYFNSGVMLLNLRRWRQVDLAGQVINFVRRKPGAIRFVDQCGLNAVINGRWTPLHPRFNVQSDFYLEPFDGRTGFAEEHFIEARSAPVIVHFTGSSKPWQFRDTHPYKRAYWRELRQTPFRRLLPDGLTPGNLVRRVMPRRVKRFLRRQLNRLS